MKTFTAEKISNTKYRLAEAPFYDAEKDCYTWVDIIDGKIYQSCKGETTVTETGQMVGACVPVPGTEKFIAAMVDGLYEFENGELKLLKNLEGVYEKHHRSNDAKMDPGGRLFFGSTTYMEGHGEGGNLYLYDKGEVKLLQPNTKIANGMAWSADNKYFFFSDSTEHAVFKYDYDVETGLISNRTVLFEVHDGVPDGMCIDEKDNLWLAVWGGRRIECHDSSTGEQIAQINVDAENVTSCCFVDRETLFITTSGEDQTGDGDGRLFKCKINF